MQKMITKSRKKNNKLVSTPPSPKRLQLFPINFTYFFPLDICFAYTPCVST